MYVPTRLRVLRIKYKITLNALAGRMNISNQHLSRMELTDIPPPSTTSVCSASVWSGCWRNGTVRRRS